MAIFMTHVTCRLTAKNRDQLRNPTLGNRVWASFTFFNVLTFLLPKEEQSIAMKVSVYLSVCLLACPRNYMSKLRYIFDGC